MARAGHEVVGGFVDALLKLGELANVREAMLWLRRIKLIAQIMEHFYAIVEVEWLVKKLAHRCFREMFKHRGRNALALTLCAWKSSGPVCDVGEEGVALVGAKPKEKERDGFALSVPFWKLSGC